MTDTSHAPQDRSQAANEGGDDENTAYRNESETHPGGLVDPVAQRPGFHETGSKIALGSHPIHAMAVAFPIALTFSNFGADAFYWWTGDIFWARAALWAAGVSFLIGLAAALTGLPELLLVPGIRQRASAWTHAAIAMVLLSLLGLNWGYRMQGFEAAVLPWGILMSGFCCIMVGVTGWHGGKLVFDYNLGGSSKGS